VHVGVNEVLIDCIVFKVYMFQYKMVGLLNLIVTYDNSIEIFTSRMINCNVVKCFILNDWNAVPIFLKYLHNT
jgi:hypothetical protein